MKTYLFNNISIFIYVYILLQYYIIESYAIQVNKSHRPQREFNNGKRNRVSTFRSFQPASLKYHKIYSKPQEKLDYDITSYDTEYGGVFSNFTKSIYDENPPLYPNPEVVASQGNQEIMKPVIDNRVSDIELPDDSLADADLKEHNIIDSVTYLYGFNNCHGMRTEWMVLVYISGFISSVVVGGAVIWLIWSQYTKEFRNHSKLYPISINLGCCLEACSIIYMQAIMGVSSPSQCEKIALLLHYTYLVCSIWIILLAATVTEYSQHNTIMSLKYNYLIAYGVPAIYVMFNYAISLEQYEIKHYCWMSIEKGMVLGFMAPAMLLILMNTGLIIVGLKSVNEKQAQMLTAKIQELVDHHVANWPKSEHGVGHLVKVPSMDTLDNLYTPCTSRKNADSCDTLDGDYIYSEDDCHYVNIGLQGGSDDLYDEAGIETGEGKQMTDKGLLNFLYMDNLCWKSTWNTEGNDLKSYLNLCLVLEPFFAINWVMGVVAIENANHWSTPTIYLILVTCMYGYLAAVITTTLPILRCKDTDYCEDVVTELPITMARTTDSIPLLDPTIQQPNVTPAPGDTISTISI